MEEYGRLEVGEDGEHGEDGCEDARLGGWEDGCEDGMMGGGVAGWEDGWKDGGIGGGWGACGGWMRGWEVGRMGGWLRGWDDGRMGCVVCMCAMMLAVLLFVGRADLCVDGCGIGTCIDVGRVDVCHEDGSSELFVGFPWSAVLVGAVVFRTGFGY